MDMSQYYGLFISEAREHVRKIGELAVLLEADPADRPTIDAIFRSAHSLKGMAASMSFTAIADLAHKMEDLMARIRDGLPVDASLFDLLLAGADQIGAMINDLESGGSGRGDSAALVARILAYSPTGQVALPDTDAAETASSPLSSAEEPAHVTPVESWAVPKTVRVKTDILDSFVNTTGELITVKHRLAMLSENCREGGFHEALRDLGRYLRDLHYQVMAVRLLPLSVITERFPRMVRDLSRELGKDVSFAMQGVDMELDRSILDLLGDPLVHILRNCVDHGIEHPPLRLAAGKPASGTLSLSVAQRKDQVEIAIVDDGKGMDPESICAAAVAKGVVSRETSARLTSHEKLMLICQPGFSTAPAVTDVSGRGVGMDVVKNTLQSLGGTLSICSEPGRGSTFILKVPLTIAIINVLLVVVGRMTVAVPLTAVIRTLEIRQDERGSVDGEEIFFLDGEEIPLLPLHGLLNIPVAGEPADTLSIFIAEIRGRRVGIQVDRVVGHQEVFVKPLARPLSVLPGLNGATILGDGQIVFILDIFHGG
ncbi:MAG TPA: chemotaxis protein CheA [Geobacteraceae bacterium]|nr:chemotaxis protein CheA [Geobacteraceae bacterium]